MVFKGVWGGFCDLQVIILEVAIIIQFGDIDWIKMLSYCYTTVLCAMMYYITDGEKISGKICIIRPLLIAIRLTLIIVIMRTKAIS